MKPVKSSKIFLDTSSSEWEAVEPKIKRKILGYDDQLMLVLVHFEKGGIGAEHQHHHSQSTLVGSGVFEITIDGVTQKLEKEILSTSPPIPSTVRYVWKKVNSSMPLAPLGMILFVKNH